MRVCCRIQAAKRTRTGVETLARRARGGGRRAPRAIVDRRLPRPRFFLAPPFWLATLPGAVTKPGASMLAKSSRSPAPVVASLDAPWALLCAIA